MSEEAKAWARLVGLIKIVSIMAALALLVWAGYALKNFHPPEEGAIGASPGANSVVTAAVK